ncbi:16182_t:CDS:2 [Racocetra fulgida]|uniref:16182_t:CDS:1 n=1 Tax=Racocetra fulgida TaxID=60492 RepID=A0A9N9EWA1_9GLOM|nr:16182_t:CDS:2 [Racocetra fulgida]
MVDWTGYYPGGPTGQVGKKAYCQEPATHAVVEGTARRVLKRYRLMQKGPHREVYNIVNI